MAYDESLAERVRDVLPENGVDEKKMFGGLSFMLQGNMACGIIKDDLLVRVGKEQYESYLKESHVYTMTKFTYKPMRGFVVVDPEIRETPEPARIEREADGYLKHLLERWRLPLAEMPESAFEPATYLSNWGTPYCVEAMLEHAVMHPIRHQFQLEELLNQR